MIGCDVKEIEDHGIEGFLEIAFEKNRESVIVRVIRLQIVPNLDGFEFIDSNESILSTRNMDRLLYFDGRHYHAVMIESSQCHWWKGQAVHAIPWIVSELSTYLSLREL